MKTKKNQQKKSDGEDNSISLAPLEFEEALADLLQIKPIPNEKIKSVMQKKKSNPKTKN